MKSLNIVCATPGPAIATDAEHRVLGWNRAARRLLGYRGRSRAIGRRVYDLLEARDVFGNRLGNEHIAFSEMIQRGEAVRSFELDARTRGGESVRLATSVIVVLGETPSQYELVYLVRPVRRRTRAEEVIERLLAHGQARAWANANGAEPAQGEPIPAKLTPRQIEILQLLSEGSTCHEIAESLCISENTVRSHIQNILARMGVHSQVDAVSRAIRASMI